MPQTADTPDLLTSALDLDEGLRSALRRHVLTLADTKRLMGIRYSDWVLGSPSLETNIATSAMAQDEWGHARLLYAMLKDFDEDPTPVEHDRDASEYASAPALDEPLEDWAAVVAAMVVVDGALTVALEGFAGGRYEAAGSRVPKMVGEEDFHRDLGNAWFRRLAHGSEEARARLTDATAAMLPGTLAWLTPDDAPFTALAGAGLVEDGDTLLFRLRERCDGLLDLVGLGIAGTGPDRDGWDETRGRGPGHPDEESVERARGDRNRSLFVE